MARQVLPIVGAIVGSFFGAPQIGFVLGSLIGNAIDPQVIKGPSIGDGQVQTSKEGVPRPIVYGTACVSGNIIDRSEIYKSIKKTRQGKGSGPVTEEERMHLTYAIRICEGPVEAVLRIWEDEKLVYDIRAGGQVSADENAKYAERFRLYLGTEDQLPDPELEVVHGAGNVPSYRGTCYIVFPRNDVTDRRGSIPQYRFEVSSLAQVVGTPAVIGYNNIVTGFPGEMTVSTQGPWAAGYLSLAISRDNRFVCVKPSSGNIEVYEIDEETQEYSFLKTLSSSSSYRFLDISYDGAYLAAASQTSGAIKTWRIGDADFELVSSATVPSLVGVIAWNHSGTAIAFGASSSSPYNSIGLINVSGGVLGSYDYRNLVVPAIHTGQGAWSQNADKIAWSAGDETIVAHSNVAIAWLSSSLEVRDYLSVFGGTYDDAGTAGIFASGSSVIATSFNGTANEIWEFSIASTYDAPSRPSSPVYSSSTSSGSRSWTDASGITADGKYLFQSHFSPWGIEVFDLSEGVSLIQTIESGVIGSASPLTVSKQPAAVIGEPGMDTVGHILRDIADRCQVPSAYMDTTEVEEIEVRGFVIAQQYTAANSMRSLQDTFFFDPGEWDNSLHFVKRGAPVRTTLTIDDLCDDPYSAERKNALEYPRKLELLYQNSTIGYDSAKAVAERNSPSVQVSGQNTMEVSIVMTSDEAYKVADMQLKVAWAEAEGEVTLSIPCAFDWLTPTDTIGIVLRDTVRRLRIDKIERADGVLALTCKADRQSAYTSAVTGIPIPEPTPPPPTITGDTELVFLNIPALQDNLDFLHYYVAGSGSVPAWYGAVVERSVEGSDFSQVSTIPPGSTVGELVEEVQAASEHYPDTTNKVRVQLYSDTGAFESVTQDQLLRENNALAIAREDGTAEILQFRDADDLGDGLWELSYLIRGRLNSGADAHAIGAQVVLLTDAQAVSANSSLIGATLLHRGISYGQSPEDAEELSDLYSPALSQTEFPVDLLTASMDTSGQVQVAWSPRERFGTDVMPVRSVNWQAYQVEATDGVNTVSATVLTPSATLDGSTLSTPITVSVSQVNRITGPGPAAQTTIG